jgi:phage terminase small subunit
MYNKIIMTYNQEMYIEYIIQGYNHRIAFIKAFPSSKSKKPSIIDSQASQLLVKPEIQEYYQKRKKEVQDEIKEKSIWNKELAMNELIDLLYTNKKESKRYEEAFYDELDLIDKKIIELEKQIKKPRQAKKVIRQLMESVDRLRWERIQVCKRHTSNKSVNEAILSSIQQLNEIMDFKNEALRNLKESENQQKIEILFNTDMEKGQNR